MRFLMMVVALVSWGCDNKVPAIAEPSDGPATQTDTGTDDDTGMAPDDDTGGANPDDTGGDPDSEDAIVVGYPHGTDLIRTLRFRSTGSAMLAQDCHSVLVYRQQVDAQYIPADADMIHVGVPERIYDGCADGTFVSMPPMFRIGFAGESVMLFTDEGWQYNELEAMNYASVYSEETGVSYSSSTIKGDTHFLWTVNEVLDHPEYGYEMDSVFMLDWGAASAGEYRSSAVFVETAAIPDEVLKATDSVPAEEEEEAVETEAVCLQVTNFTGWSGDELSGSCGGCDDSATFTGRLVYNDCGVEFIRPIFSWSVDEPNTFGLGTQTDSDALLIREDTEGAPRWMRLEEFMGPEDLEQSIVRDENTVVWSADIDWGFSLYTQAAFHFTWR